MSVLAKIAGFCLLLTKKARGIKSEYEATQAPASNSTFKLSPAFRPLNSFVGTKRCKSPLMCSIAIPCVLTFEILRTECT